MNNKETGLRGTNNPNAHWFERRAKKKEIANDFLKALNIKSNERPR